LHPVDALDKAVIVVACRAAFVSRLIFGFGLTGEIEAMNDDQPWLDDLGLLLQSDRSESVSLTSRCHCSARVERSPHRP